MLSSADQQSRLQVLVRIATALAFPARVSGVLSGQLNVTRQLYTDSLTEQCVMCTAGLSLGGYCALVFAGVLTFEGGLKIMKVRAESMAAAATSGDKPHRGHLVRTALWSPAAMHIFPVLLWLYHSCYPVLCWDHRNSLP